MKTKRFFSTMISLSMMMSCMTGATANTTSGLSESYDVTDPEISVQVIADDALTFTNNESLNSGITETGMTKSKVFDSEKGKDVMKLAFNEKVAWNSANNDSTRLYDVMSSLNGLSDLLVDGSANTISFDYKVTGSSTGNVGMFFVGKDATELSDYQTRYPLIGLRNGGGITAVARPAAVRGPWNNYVAAEGWASHDSDNTQWNRLTIAIDGNGTGVTDVYLNGQKVKFVTNSDGYIGNATKDKGEIDKILFNTAGEVSQTKDLAVLLDNIKVYEGEPKLADTTALTSEFDLINDTSNTGFANMTDGYVLDPVKGAVRKLTFNAKAAEANVRAGLSGFGKYMTNDTVNTVCFDYKLSGSSKNHVGLFLNDTAGAGYWSNTCTAMILGNSESVQLRNRPNYNASDWYSYAGNTNFYQATPNNREWNRAILEVNNVTGEVKGYINGEYYGTISGSTTSPANLDTIFFNTEPLVGAGGTSSLNGLSILLDNIEIYEGAAKLDTSEITFDLTLLNDTSNPGFANMTDGYVFEPGKGTVRKLTFNAKAEDANVRAGLSGFGKYMTDDVVNTICFDYKLSGTSKNHVGFFLNDTAGASYWSNTCIAMILGNEESIQLRNRPNYNASDWYSYAGNSNRYQAKPNNREWNRAMLEINNVTGEVKGYINREYYGVISGATTSPANLDTIFFNTKPAVGADETDPNGSLSILLDNVEVYPGAVNVKDADYIEVVDAQGESISEFNAGDTVYVKAGVKNETETVADYLVILAVYDEFGACVDVKVQELKAVQPGEGAHIEGTVLGLTLPNDATNVKAFLWNSWDSITPVCEFDTAVLKTAE